MNITNIAAWWGAIIATCVLIWDIYKWLHSGPVINVTASPDMQFIGASHNIDKKKKFISVEVTNTGDRSTTITNLIMFYYNSFISKVLNKRSKSFIAVSAFPQQIPFLIESGGRWLGGIEQTNDL